MHGGLMLTYKAFYNDVFMPNIPLCYDQCHNIENFVSNDISQTGLENKIFQQ